MSKNIFDNLDVVLSKDENEEFLIDTETDYTKVESEKSIVNDKEEPSKKKEEDKNLIDISDSEEDKEKESSEIKDGNVFKTLATVLKEEGIFTTIDVEKLEGKPEELIAGIQAEIKDGIDGYKESMHPKIKYLQDNFEEGVPLDELIGIISEQQRFDNIDENTIKEDVQLQKDLVAYHLSQTTKWSEAKIKKEVDRLADVDEIEAEAYDAHKELKSLALEAENELKNQAKAKESKRLQDLKDTNEKITKTATALTEIIPGIKVTDKEKQALVNSMTKAVAFTSDNKPISKAIQERQKDPIKFDLMLNYFIDKGFFEGKFDTILTKVKSDSLKQLEKQAETIIPKSGRPGVNSNSTGASLIEAYKKIKK